MLTVVKHELRTYMGPGVVRCLWIRLLDCFCVGHVLWNFCALSFNIATVELFILDMCFATLFRRVSHVLHSIYII